MTSRVARTIGIAAVVAGLSTGVQAQTAVPYVGCNSDGQMGPLPAPSAPNESIEVDAAAARQLAYYKAENGPGVLGPRGWNCVGFYGSSGTTLVVAPGPPVNITTIRIPGAAIQLSLSLGGTSGRFTVAQVAARVFPAERNFVQRVIAEGFPPASDFPFGAYAGDRLVYVNDRAVEFQTPPDSEGLGTMSRLQQSGDAIRGVAILQNSEPDLLLLAVRLPSAMSALATSIIQQVEQQR
jgi:hypothetical protein